MPLKYDFFTQSAEDRNEEMNDLMNHYVHRPVTPTDSDFETSYEREYMTISASTESGALHTAVGKWKYLYERYERAHCKDCKIENDGTKFELCWTHVAQAVTNSIVRSEPTLQSAWRRVVAREGSSEPKR